MNKKLIAIGAVSLVFILLLFMLFKPDSFEKKWDTTMKNISAYKLEGNMDIQKGEETKKYALEVGYKKYGKKDCFKVSITDKELNQTQVILRNKEGVYVLTPTLNQIFKFEGDWPLNTLKPYLLQSMQEILKNESCTIVKKHKDYWASSKVTYPNNVNFKTQDMVFDTDAKIKKLVIKDENKVEQLAITFTSVNYDAKFNSAYFDVPDEMDAQVSAPVVSEQQLPLYPMNIYDATLKSSKTLEVSDGVRHVLEYQGDQSFTLIESIKNRSETLETVIMPGQFVDSIDGFGFFDGNHMQMIKDGIEYTLYSDSLTPEEMSEILGSLQVVALK